MARVSGMYATVTSLYVLAGKTTVPRFTNCRGCYIMSNEILQIDVLGIVGALLPSRAEACTFARHMETWIAFLAIVRL